VSQRKCDAAINIGGKATRCPEEGRHLIGEKRYCVFHVIQRLVTRITILEERIAALEAARDDQAD
jgi:hypothetical protein